MTKDEFRAWRKARLVDCRPMTQAQAAAAIGVARETVVRYESGALPVPLTVHKLCAALTAIDSGLDSPVLCGAIALTCYRKLLESDNSRE